MSEAAPVDSYVYTDDQAIVDSQEKVLASAFAQLNTTTVSSRTVKGPWFNDFASLMASTNDALKQIDPELDPSFLFAKGYYSHDVYEHRLQMGFEARAALQEVKNERFDRLSLLARDKIRPALEQQVIKGGVLDTTPYHQQGEEEYDGYNRACSMACFRMIWGAMAGWSPGERRTADYLTAYFNRIVVDDDVYMKLLSSKAFQEDSSKKVASVEVFGADLQYLSGITQKLRQNRPDAEVYCTVALSSEGLGKVRAHDIWHKSVLLSADREAVICNDPSTVSGGEKVAMDHQSFAERWAMTNNAARLVLAIPQA